MLFAIRSILAVVTIGFSFGIAAAAPRPAFNFTKTFGGSGPSAGTAVAVDAAGNVYTAGNTSSLNLPVVNAFQPRLGGANLRSSSDQGGTWTVRTTPYPVYAAAGSPKKPNVIFAGTTKGVFKSSDSGNTWTNLLSAPPYVVNAVVVDSGNPDLIHAATIGGEFRSQEGGVSWLLEFPLNCLVLVSSPLKPSTLFSARGGLIPVQGEGGVSLDPKSNVYRTQDG